MTLSEMKKTVVLTLACGAGLLLSACFNDDDPVSEKYREWRERNEAFVEEAEARTNEDGTPYYTRIVPSWAPDAFSLVHWHNDRSLSEGKLKPMDNSTVQITYELFDIDGKRISDSFSSADSLYTSQPNRNIVGVWSTLTQMSVGDSVSIVIPSQAGYGISTYGGISPYSTLIYNIKLKAIKTYDLP